MSLADYVPLRTTVKIGKSELTVRGIGLDDVIVLMHRHLVDIDHVFELYGANVSDSEKVAATVQYIISLVSEAPALVAHIIALAADEPDQVDKARSLSVAAQVELLKAIATMTFEEAGGAKNFFGSLAPLLQGMLPNLPKTDSRT